MATMVPQLPQKSQNASRNTKQRKSCKTLKDEEIIKMLELYDEGAEVSELAEHFDVCVVTVRRILQNYGKYEPAYSRHGWNEEQLKELRCYIEDGKSNKEIAEIMGRSYSSIVSIIYKCGCKRK